MKNPMDPFDFLLGDWLLDYRIPESKFSKPATDKGKGSFRRVLNDKYVTFEYSTLSGSAARGVFAWEEQKRLYRYWWFENSGNFNEASCDFIADNVLAMNWYNSLFIQTFTLLDSGKVLLSMEYPDVNEGYKPVLEVLLSRH